MAREAGAAPVVPLVPRGARRESGVPLAGRGVVGVTRSGSRSVVTRAYATSPLRLLTPGNHGHAAWIFTSSYGGGFVDGDRIEMDVAVGGGAAAFLSSQASTKVYRSPGGTSACVRAHVGRRGLLVAAPDPVICYAGSRYRQEQSIELEADASLVLIDILSSGRRAAGERWAFAEYASRIDVRMAGRRVVHESLMLRASDGDIEARMGRFDVLAIGVVAGARLAQQAAAIVAATSALPVQRGLPQLMAAAPIADGCVFRVAGSSVEQVTGTMRTQLAFVPALLGDDPWLRKW